MTTVIGLVAHCCPIEAIVWVFGFQARTVREWVDKAGTHCEAVHTELVVQQRDLGQVQADEIRVKTQKGIVWTAMALMVSNQVVVGRSVQHFP
jgi:hypothetical protein